MNARAHTGPFPFDPIRRAAPGDLAVIARIHLHAFPDSFLTSLGSDFLIAYYRLVRDDPGGILLVHAESGRVAGFIAGFLRPADFYARMKTARWTLLGCVIRALLKRPSLAGRIFYHVRRLVLGTPRAHPEECELSSLAVLPRGWNRGSGRLLVQAFLEQAWTRGAKCVYLTADAAENARVNQFYRRLGFELRESFEQYRGRVLNEYVYRLDQP